jgi:hypothetical protein
MFSESAEFLDGAADAPERELELKGSTVFSQRGVLTKFAGVSAALVAFFAAPAPASAAATAFPDLAFHLYNPSQSYRCAQSAYPSYVGALTLQTCNNIAYDNPQFFFAYETGANTELVLLYAPGHSKCLFDSGTAVSTKDCTGSANSHWLSVGKTLRNVATGKCLSANSAGQVYPAACDGAINRDWELTTFVYPPISTATRKATEDRRAELAATR